MILPLPLDYTRAKRLTSMVCLLSLHITHWVPRVHHFANLNCRSPPSKQAVGTSLGLSTLLRESRWRESNILCSPDKDCALSVDRHWLGCLWDEARCGWVTDDEEVRTLSRYISLMKFYGRPFLLLVPKLTTRTSQQPYTPRSRNL